MAPAPASSAASAPPSAVRRASTSAAALVGSVGHYFFFVRDLPQELCAILFRVAFRALLGIRRGLGLVLPGGIYADPTSLQALVDGLLAVPGNRDSSRRSRLCAAHGKPEAREGWR